ncbi:MAG TPA: NADH-quinone oxidoreductase subunit J [Polyangiaceae bacterium]|nr:NADH-quinone oxidoreductase subunit J [Polyangiaceae bacterium]
MSAGDLLFGICSVLCVTGALIVVLAKNPIRGAMGLLSTIIGIAGLFLRLNAQFLAAMQLLVYAGAVVILFVFVVMLLGPNAAVTDRGQKGATASRMIGALLIGLIGAGALRLFTGLETHSFTTIGPEHGSVEAVGGMIFNEALVPFELATVLLIVAVVGAIAVARTVPSAKKKPVVDNPTLRMFHGPLHPRDAERPLDGRLLTEIAINKESV